MNFPTIVAFIIFFASINIAQQDEKLELYFFLAPQCTICNYYVGSINDLFEDHQENYKFIAVFPNRSTSQGDMDSFMKINRIPFESILDHEKSISSKLDAKKTPEVVAYNSQTQKILYRGRIDDIYVSLGKRKLSAREYSLKDFLQSYSNSPIDSLTTNKVIGCLINYADEK